MDEDVLQLWHHYLGRSTIAASPTVVTYDAGYVVLSFFTSLIGCLTTIELLQRRTSMRGAYNWFLLVASAITMGGIGIWAMHFVGNRAIVLDRGHPQRQILYNKGFTAASFFLPIIVLLFAFYTLGTSAKARQLQVAAAGVLTGAAVCGMHYMGQLGIANYNCSYRPQNVVGAAIISVVASLISLSLFFRMRDKWTDVWWKRTLCAVVLAIAVSGMHWTAAIGTIYHWRGDLSVHGDSRTTTSVATSCLSMGSCIMLLVVIGIRGRKRRNARITSQRLVLACSYFDDKGNLMVTQDGLLPNTKITNQYIERTFGEDELSRSHDTFHWIFRASHQWTIFKDLIAGMKKDIEGDPTTKQYRPGSHTTTLPDDTSEISVNFARVFEELFCVAAQQLANTLHEPLEKIGVLFEEPMDTGTVCCSPSTPTGMRKSSIFSSSTAVDVERGKGINSFTKGKYLFLVREIQRGEMAKFAALGYRFAAVEQIADPLAKSMQVNRADLVERMKRIRTSAARTCLPPPGVYLSCFMLRPSMYKSFDILVLDSAQNQIPHVTLQLPDLSPEQSKQLQSLDEMQVSEVLKVLVNKSSKPNNVDIDEGFRWQLYNAFLKLVDAVGDYDSMMAAKFSARQFQVSCQHGGGCGSSGSCTTCKFYSIRALRNIHASPTRSDLTYVPLSFFSIQQQVHTGHPDDNGFARKVERQFGHLHRDAALSMGTSVARGRSPSPAESNSQGADSPRIPIFRNPLRRSVVRRRSDEATIVDHETAVPDATDTEMTRVRSLDEDYPAGEAGESESERKPCWVSELFSLFQTKCEPGWGSARPGGWKWDISVQNSVEIATKDRRKGSNVVCASF